MSSPVLTGLACAMLGLDAASGLPPPLVAELAETPGSRALRYPGSTLTAVLFNQRPHHVFRPLAPIGREAFGRRVTGTGGAFKFQLDFRRFRD